MNCKQIILCCIFLAQCVSVETNNSNNCTPDCTTTCIDTDRCNHCHSIYIPRSQHSNSAYFSSPATSRLHVGFEYQHSFRGADIAHCLFGTDLLFFQGSQLPNRDSNALIADYFGLSPLFDGTLRVTPEIQNINLHFSARYDTCTIPGLYGEIWATVSHQRRTLFDDCPCDNLCTGTNIVTPFPVGSMAQNQVIPAPNILTALSGKFIFGDMQTPWKFGRISNHTLHKTALAGISVIVGYNFVDDPCGSFGIFGIYTAPTAGKSDSKQLFNPIIGNGGYHELGGGISVYSPVWQDDEDRSIAFYLYGFATTLLAQTQIRSFDFKERGCLSRYMLLKKLTSPSALDEHIFTSLGDTHGPGFSYDHALINGINFATRAVHTKVHVKGDASLQWLYQHGGFELAIGYNIYGHSAETISFIGAQTCGVRTNDLYGFKGCTGVYTFAYNSTNNGTLIGTALPELNDTINATSSDATIRSCGTVDGDTTNGLTMFVSNGTDNFVGIDWQTGINGPQANAVPTGTAVSALQITHLSNPARAISIQDLDRCSGAAPSQISHKGFVTLAYYWQRCACTPFIEAAFEAEGSGGCCNYKQVGFWIKGGCIF